MTPFFLSDRDRLLLAFANLASYGIAARDAYGDSATGPTPPLPRTSASASPTDRRLRLLDPHRRRPLLRRLRRLIAELPLHTGASGTVEAVRTAVALEGIELDIDGDELRALGTGTLTPG